ncbi:T115 [Tupaiid betaherpesvirus 1]|uniref:Envelope glycoprotein L n=1 Tax=Tupaiid herpesvirus 1 (strain 1) TaxID=10397 RepID=Q91TI6_TUHV1|nr:T115 [Tupaiid betaherpesvirus 1]AAK57161.1 T115 [Tupaiid betaherpesvirus 1]
MMCRPAAAPVARLLAWSLVASLTAHAALATRAPVTPSPPAPPGSGGPVTPQPPTRPGSGAPSSATRPRAGTSGGGGGTRRSPAPTTAEVAPLGAPARRGPPVSDPDCFEAVTQCLLRPGERPSHRLDEDPSRPLFPRRWVFSEFLRYRPQTSGNLTGPISIDREFLDALALLYNNEDQLRVLLTLLRSDRAPDWIKLLHGYGDCVSHSTVYTCVADRCREHDLTRLQYTRTLFTEDVLGFELRPPFGLSVLVALRNKNTKTESAVRIALDQIALFDAVFNVIKHYLLTHRLHDAPLLRQLNAYHRRLAAPYRESPPPNLLRRTADRHGSPRLDARQYP